MNPSKMGTIVWATMFPDTFPAVNVADVYITDQYNTDYNCISWTLGKTDDWEEPGSLAYMRGLYKAHGFYEVAAGAADAEVDLMGTVGYIGHATTIYRGPNLAGMPNGLWESKMTEDMRITHSRFGLVGTRYGQVIASFKRN